MLLGAAVDRFNPPVQERYSYSSSSSGGFASSYPDTPEEPDTDDDVAVRPSQWR